MSTKMSKGKFDGINAVANDRGIIAAAAMDQRGSLQKTIAKSRGEGGKATPDDLTQFKIAVARVLTRYATGILLDPEYGLPALKAKAPQAGALLAYEKTGYDANDTARMPDLLDQWSVRRLVEAGADAIKILLYYNPFDEERVNTVKQAFIERIGSECIGEDVPFFLEVVNYNNSLGDEKGLAFAREKPRHVTASIAEYTKPRYGVDVLKVEVPVNMAFVEGTSSFKGTAAYTRQQTMGFFREAAAAATKPFIYLSAGVSNEVFLESLELAAEAGTRFAGVLCGRATWQNGIPVYATGGAEALTAWLEQEGVRNITALNAVLAKAATPWWDVYGGRDSIEVVGSGRTR
jgi:tagatose 1,6-diphosphate aldolase